MIIEKLGKGLNANERQWAGIAVLSELAQVSQIDLGIRNSVTRSFQNFLGCDINSHELVNALSAARARNSKDGDVYFRPARSQQASVIMLDDLPLESALNLAFGKSHMLIETSPGNYQLWLKTDRLLAEPERKQVQHNLVIKYGGDVGSTSGEHYGRVCGFKNRKPQYNLPWVNLTQYCRDGESLEVALALAPVSTSSRGACALAVCDSTKRSSPSRSSEDLGESHREFKYACESLRQKVNRQTIIKNIADRALRRGKRRTVEACVAYASRTVEKAEAAI